MKTSITLVSFLFDKDSTSGAVKVAYDLAVSLVNSGFKVSVISVHAQQACRVEYVDGIKVYRVGPNNLYWVANKDQHSGFAKGIWQLIDFWNPFIYRVVRGILEQERPDIVHVHKLRGLSPSVWHASYRAGIANIIQTCHDYELMSPQGTLTGRVGQMARDNHWLLRPYSNLRARFSKLVAAATAPSFYTLDVLLKQGFFPQSIVKVISNSHGFDRKQLQSHIDQMDFQRITSMQEATCRFLYLGRLDPVKGVEVLCKGFVKAAACLPDITLDIVGAGPLETYLRGQYGDHPLIRFHGAQYGRDKKRLIESSDVLVVPSLCQEVFGIVIVEAFALGKPVIATKVGGIPELVEPGRTGFLIPPNDVDAMTRAIVSAGKNPDTVRSMAEACCLEAVKFTKESVVERYTSLYGELLSRSDSTM